VSLSALPALFIASSTEGLPVAYDIQEALEHDCHATVWKQGVFEASSTVLDDLLACLKKPQFALFVFTPDDSLRLRGASHRVVRDNVVFEMGLFIGAFGLPRCMHIVPRGVGDLHLPSDLLGLTALDYPVDRPDKNRIAALGPACNKIRRRLRDAAVDMPVAPPWTATTSASPPSTAGLSLQRYLSAWDSAPLVDDRSLLRAGVILDAADASFPRDAIRRVFNFLESLSEAVLSGAVDEACARATFGPTLAIFWPHAATLLAPPNHADDFWDPAPRIAELFRRWR
jgi:hypothetical protein